MRTETATAWQTIMDVMACKDGGERFINLRLLIEKLDQMAADGDKDAEEVMNIMKRFSRLTTLAERLSNVPTI